MLSKHVLNRHFARHYAVMVLVMFLGMAVLALPAEWALGTVDSSWSELKTDSPALMLLLMAFTMSAPMSAWMYRMGRGWQPNVEMALSMIIPTLGVIGLHAAGLVQDVGALLLIEHVAMLAGMFGVMVARPEEHSGHHRHNHPVTA